MKTNLLIVLSVFISVLAYGQSENKTFQLGFTVSPNIGWPNISNGGDSYSADGVRAGVSYGVLGDFGFAPNYFFSTAFTLTNIHTRISSAEAGQGNTATNLYKVQYIEIPLTLKLKTNDKMGKSFYGQFGLSTGIKTRSRADIKVTDQFDAIVSKEKNLNISSDTNMFRLGLVAGAGVQWNYNENSKIATGVTLNNGFTKVLDGQPEFQSAYLALNIGVFF